MLVRKPTNRHELRRRSTHEALRQAALKSFACKGFANVTVTELAREAGVTERTFFRHFPTKEAVLFQDYETARELGSRIAKASEGKRVIVIASSDFSHYVPPQEAKRKDTSVIEKILKLNAKGVETAVMSQDISMCGYGPVMAMLEAVKGEDAELLKYATSGDVTPMSEVVGYAGIVVTR